MPLAEYYIINGIIYQAPDMASIVNSRVSQALLPLREAFEQCTVGYCSSFRLAENVGGMQVGI